ncbi:MAG: hypothetical protein JWM10_2868 [Myxococcaceae bacterium]|nr:hypothetical protein [Myxococcaceae bacterium]
MPIDERQREWAARVHEHKTLARLLRQGRLVREDRARYDALTAALLDELLHARASAVAAEEVVGVVPAAPRFGAPHEGVEGVDAAGVVAGLGGRAESL